MILCRSREREAEVEVLLPDPGDVVADGADGVALDEGEVRAEEDQGVRGRGEGGQPVRVAELVEELELGDPALVCAAGPGEVLEQDRGGRQVAGVSAW